MNHPSGEATEKIMPVYTIYAHTMFDYAIQFI